MEALKEFDIEELLKRQAMLDKKFDEKKTLRGRSQIRTYIAYFTELGTGTGTQERMELLEKSH